MVVAELETTQAKMDSSRQRGWEYTEDNILLKPSIYGRLYEYPDGESEAARNLVGKIREYIGRKWVFHCIVGSNKRIGMVFFNLFESRVKTDCPRSPDFLQNQSLIIPSTEKKVNYWELPARIVNYPIKGTNLFVRDNLRASYNSFKVSGVEYYQYGVAFIDASLQSIKQLANPKPFLRPPVNFNYQEAMRA